ncbi:hypothetical protein LUZ60_003519 [Juncus effusus]|nr:hypothetical protein LUZ60_003519 [Juncus effusus]
MGHMQFVIFLNPNQIIPKACGQLFMTKRARLFHCHHKSIRIFLTFSLKKVCIHSLSLSLSLSQESISPNYLSLSLPPSPLMATSPVIRVVQNQDTELKEMEQGNSNLNSTSQGQPLQTSSSVQNPTLFNKTLTSTANLAQLLPTGTVLAFQTLAPSFTNRGVCTVNSNKYLTGLLVGLCFLSCIALSFTDSLIGRDGKIYYGVATFKGFYVFNFTGSDDESDGVFTNLQKLRIKTIDFVHSFFTAIVFLSVSFSDTGVQNCLFQHPNQNTTELLVNLPLGAAVLSSLVFMMFPTTRKGIGYTNVTHNS